jgi:pimeloyl-ACP methyl ester carboxylesterase
MLMFTIPVLIGGGLLAVLWLLSGLTRVWPSIPRTNDDFDLATGVRSARSGPARNPAGAFYSASATAQVMGAGLRAIERIAPSCISAAALRVFVTPLPWKLSARRDVPSRWETSAWPFEDVSLAVYRRRAIPHDRPPVLLVHGWAGSGAQMFRIGDALADAGFAPVLLDFPGHGRSGGWRSTLPQFVRAIHAAAARIGPLHGIVAHSLGAIAAMHSTARGLAAGRLVLIAPSASPALFLRWFAGSFGLSDAVPEAMRRAIESRESVGLDQFEPEWLGPRINQRVLVIHDRQDRIAPFAAGEHVVRWLSYGRLLPTQGLGHARVLDDRGVAREIVAHLA